MIKPSKINSRKIIYICCQDSTKANINWAKFFTELVYNSGNTPIAPCLLYPDYINTPNLDKQEEALAAKLSLLHRCDEVWVFGDSVTIGMGAELTEARTLDIPIKRVKIFNTIKTAYRLDITDYDSCNACARNSYL